MLKFLKDLLLFFLYKTEGELGFCFTIVVIIFIQMRKNKKLNGRKNELE